MLSAFSFKCFKCGKKGHKQTECKDKNPENCKCKFAPDWMKEKWNNNNSNKEHGNAAMDNAEFLL